MPEQSDEKLKEIDAQQFITPKDQLGYAEEFITIKFKNPKNNLLLNYSLSNSMEDIKMAIFKRTGFDIKLENAKWYLNTCLSISVKDLMKKHQVIYSMTTYYKDNIRLICINMNAGDYWFYTSYGEISGKCFTWDYFKTLDRVKHILDEIEGRFLTNDD